MFMFLGYLLQGAIFIASGVHKIQKPAETAAVIKTTMFPKYFNMVTDGKVPMDLFVQALGALFVLFGAMLVLGVMRKYAAFFLAMLIIPVTAFVHVNLADPAKTKPEDMIACMKNAAILGGLLVVAFAPSKKVVAPVERKASPSAKKTN